MLNRLVHRPVLASLLLAILGLFTYLPALGDGLAARQQELRVLLTARDMASGGDWIVPHFMGEERLRKPPLMYWLSALSMKALSTEESAFAARLPAALAGVSLLLVTWLGGRSLVGRRAAWLGAFALASTAGLLRHARLAETDIVQTLSATTATVCAFRALMGGGKTWGWWVTAGLAAGVGALTKGPGPVAVPLAALALYAALDRRRVPLVRLGVGIALILVLTAAIALPWYVAVSARTAATGSQVASEASLLLSESRHPGPFYYYVYTLPGRLGLWAIPFLASLPWIWSARHHTGVRMLGAWMGSCFLMLSCISGKQPHYALLLLPPACLMAGMTLDQAIRGRTTRPARIVNGTIIGAMALVVVASVVGIVLSARNSMDGLLTGTWPWIGLAGFICGAALLCPRRTMAGFLGLGVAFGLGTIAYAAHLEPRLDEDAVVRSFIRSHRDEISSAPTFVVAGPHAAMATFYAERSFTALAEWTNAPTGSLLLLSSRKNKPLENPPARGLVDEAQVRGVHIALFQKALGGTS